MSRVGQADHTPTRLVLEASGSALLPSSALSGSWLCPEVVERWRSAQPLPPACLPSAAWPADRAHGALPPGVRSLGGN